MNTRSVWRSGFALLFVIAGLGCSGSQLKDEWEENRGYSPADVSLIMNRMKGYQRILITGNMQSNRFNSMPKIEARNRLKAVFCACYKRMAARCRQRSMGLAAADKELWLNSNAVEMAIASQETALDATASQEIDPAECS